MFLSTSGLRNSTYVSTGQHFCLFLGVQTLKVYKQILVQVETKNRNFKSYQISWVSITWKEHVEETYESQIGLKSDSGYVENKSWVNPHSRVSRIRRKERTH